MSRAGSMQDVTIAGRTFNVTADADVGRKLGGFENERQMNGNGTSRNIGTRAPWMLGGVTVECDDDNGDQEFLQDIADAGVDVPITGTYLNGDTYQGTGCVQGEISYSNSNGTASFELSGSGKLQKA